jgi:predicted ribosome quality control (RQC) complex YloA/Tae2 family protein
MIRVDMKRIVTRYIPTLKLNVVYKVGKDADNNYQIIDESDKEDIWFHLKNSSSCHVIACLKNIKFNRYDDELPNYYNIDFDNLDKKQKQQVIKQGALLCKQFSKLKNQKNLEIIYTKIENVYKTETVGSVISYKTKTIIV